MVRTNFMRLAKRVTLIGLLVAAAWISDRAPVLVVQASTAPQQEQQGQVVGEGTNRAALIVRYEDGSVQTRCVAFPEPELRGDELLERSGFAPVIAAEGSVCSINGVGCASDDCFCRCPFPECEYWAYYHWLDGVWSYSSLGATSHRMTDGALEGWSWGQGNFQQGVEPPIIPFEQICQDAAVSGETSMPSPAAAAAVADLPTPARPPLEGSASSRGAFVQRNPGDAASMSDAARELAESRSFSPGLLPGYVAYVLTLTILAVIGWTVLRRKNGYRMARVRQLAPDERWPSHEVHGREHE